MSITDGLRGGSAPAAMAPRIVRVASVSLTAAALPWSYPETEQARIDAHWAHSIKANPKYFNGTVYTLTDLVHDTSAVRATLAPIEFRQFLYWRDQGKPAGGIRDAFGAAIVRSREGHVMLVRAAQGMLCAGRLTFVSGFIDLNDRTGDGMLDLAACTGRELGEEAGLGPDCVAAEPGYIVAEAEAMVLFGVVYRSSLAAVALRARMLDFVRSSPAPEIDDVVIAVAADTALMRDLQPTTALALGLVLGVPGGAGPTG